MKNKRSKADKLAEAYREVSAAISILKSQQDVLADELIGMSNCSRLNPSAEMLTEKHRVLISYIKKCRVPTHWRRAHVKVTRCEESVEHIARKNKRVKICSELTARALFPKDTPLIRATKMAIGLTH